MDSTFALTIPSLTDARRAREEMDEESPIILALNEFFFYLNMVH